MQAQRTALWTCIVSLCWAAAAVAGPLDDLYQLRSGKTARVSSSDRDWKHGNDDCRGIAPGQTLTIAEINGPGVIRHIWFTISAEDPQYGRSLVLRMYWDGGEQPAVEAPIGDFFAVGHGRLRTLNSMPVAISSDGRALNCYWPMPFLKGAKITLTNDSKKYKVGCVYSYVDYEEGEPDVISAARRRERPQRAGSPQVAYFHAQYRQEYPAKLGQDYLILHAEGRGHYVGTVLSAVQRTPGWFGEGDDRFFIDGAEEPQLRGTGTEDYFCDAWGFRLLERPFYGITVWEGFDFGDRVTAYRWHVNDPIRFEKSLKVTIEHKGGMAGEDMNVWSGYEERSDLYSSVAYWYQTGTAKRFAEMPPLEERVVPRTIQELELSREKLKAEPADTPIQIQDGPYSAGKQLLVQFAGQQSTLTIPFELKTPLKGLLRINLTRSWDYGLWRVSLDGKVLRGMESLDLFSPAVTPGEHRAGYTDLAAGEHTLKFECLGKNEKSKGYFLGVDAFSIEHLTPYLVNKPEKKQ